MRKDLANHPAKVKIDELLKYADGHNGNALVYYFSFDEKNPISVFGLKTDEDRGVTIISMLAVLLARIEGSCEGATALKIAEQLLETVKCSSKFPEYQKLVDEARE